MLSFSFLFSGILEAVSQTIGLGCLRNTVCDGVGLGSRYGVYCLRYTKFTEKSVRIP